MKEYKQEVLNPETNRRIQISSKKTSKWYDFMFQRGGYVAYRNKLVPIDRDLLLKGVSTKQNNDPSNQKIQQESPEDPIDEESWFQIEPIILTNNKQNEKTKPNIETYISEIMFVHKPPDLLTVPGKTQPDCLSSRVISTLPSSQKTQYKSNTNQNTLLPKPCHRLDRDTSGIVVFGVTPEAHRDISIQFQDRETKKSYVALVAGIVDQDIGTIDLPIGKQKSQDGNYMQWAINGEEKPREAVTHWKVSRRFPDWGYTRIHLYPQTGRGHQLRLHMKAIGHPILGDTIHAPESIAKATPRLCLHAEELEIGVAGERIKAISLPPF